MSAAQEGRGRSCIEILQCSGAFGPMQPRSAGLEHHRARICAITSYTALQLALQSLAGERGSSSKPEVSRQGLIDLRACCSSLCGRHACANHHTKSNPHHTNPPTPVRWQVNFVQAAAATFTAVALMATPAFAEGDADKVKVGVLR